METKKCTKCGKILPVEMFRWRNQSKGQRRAQCKICQSLQDKKYYKNSNERQAQVKQNTLSYIERNAKYIEERRSVGCQKCGEQRPYLLDFHHVNPAEKEYTIHEMRGYSLERLQKELDKCVVLCANCHREFHHFNRLNGISYDDYIQGTIA